MRNLGFVGGVLLVLSALPASAGLIGQPVTVDYIYPDQATVYQVLGSGTVTAGGFTVNSYGQHNVTVTDSQFILQNVFDSSVNFTPASFNGYEVIETAVPRHYRFHRRWRDKISGFDASRVSFDGTHLFVNMHDLTTQANQEAVLRPSVRQHRCAGANISRPSWIGSGRGRIDAPLQTLTASRLRQQRNAADYVTRNPRFGLPGTLLALWIESRRMIYAVSAL